MTIKRMQCKINLTKDQQTRFMLDITTTKWWPSCSIIFSSWLFFSASNSPCCFHSIASGADSCALTLSQTAAARSHAPLLPLFSGSTLSLALRRSAEAEVLYLPTLDWSPMLERKVLEEFCLFRTSPQSMYQELATHLLVVLHSFYFSWQYVQESIIVQVREAW